MATRPFLLDLVVKAKERRRLASVGDVPRCRYISGIGQARRWQPERPTTVRVTLLIVVGLAVLAGCIYVLPWVLVPDRPAGSLAAVTDPARRLELEDERLKEVR
jgi:hypothetical protein